MVDQTSIAGEDLRRVIGTPAAPWVIDVRRAGTFAADEMMIAGALRRDPLDVKSWVDDLPAGRPVVVYGHQGREISLGVAAALRMLGVAVRVLDDGIVGWKAAGGPTRRKHPALADSHGRPSRWVTRARPRIDRIACPWLIRRFIDPSGEILYVPAEKVASVAAAAGAVPFDVPGAEFGHAGDRCSFDAFLDRFGLDDPGLLRLAPIVRGADTGHPERAAEAPGLLAIADGLRILTEDDDALLAQGMLVYDALYAWSRQPAPAP